MICPIPLTEIQNVEIEWLWKPFIAFGKVTLVQGETGIGKTSLMIKLLADLSNGVYPPTMYHKRLQTQQRAEPLKSYGTPDRNNIDEPMIRKVAGALACVHADSVPEFLNSTRKHSDILPGQQIEEYRTGWECVLKEHPGSFDETPLHRIVEKINKIITWNNSEEKVLIHGDFHWDNLLEDENGSIRICDWQSVGMGGASGDLSFSMSRLESDCVGFDLMLFLKCYADAILDIGGHSVDIQSLAGHIAAANVITSFVFWHQFLHGAETERIRDIYEKMTGDFQILIDNNSI